MFSIIRYTFLMLCSIPIIPYSRADRLPKEYLPLASTANPIPQADEIKWVFEQVTKRGGLNFEETANYLHRAAARAEKVAHQAPQSTDPDEDDTGVSKFSRGEIYNLRDVLEKFVEMSSPAEYKQPICMKFNIQHFMNTIKIGFGNLDNFLALFSSGADSGRGKPAMFDYMKHYSRVYYTECLSQIESRFTKKLRQLNQEIESEFDKMISMNNGRSLPGDDQSLSELAQQVNFLDNNFNARRMLSAIEYHIHIPYHEHDSAKRFTRFLEGKCAMLTNHLGDIFDAYNLSRVLVPEKAANLNMSARFFKLNEYIRICRQLQNPATREVVMGNIERNMDNIWYKKALNKIVSRQRQH